MGVEVVDVLVGLLHKGGKVADGAGHHAAEDEVEGAREGPEVLNVGDLEGDVWGDAGW